MTPGNVTMNVEFTDEYPDKTNANLSVIYPSAGSISPAFTPAYENYTITVPFGTTEFYISAQAENPYLEPILRPAGVDGDNLLGADLMSDENDLPLTEGSNEYQITVTSGDNETTKTYIVDVILLPDLSLETFQITKDDFVRDLAPLDTQTVYLPYQDGIAVVAAPNDTNAAPTIPTVPILPAMSGDAETVTVTVSKSVNGEVYSKDYVLNLHYAPGADLTPLATGGYVSFIPDDENPGAYYEVHTFLNPGDDTLLFVDTSLPEVQADILVVAGGGGAGGNKNASLTTDLGGGDGAGGLLYQTNQPLTLENYAVTVMVGRGGQNGELTTDGEDGGYSSIGNIEVPGGGGGGGGGRNIAGRPGGSGGGGGAGASEWGLGYGGGGNGKSHTAGYAGGNPVDSRVVGSAGGSSSNDPGGSGGGATGPGNNGGTQRFYF